MVRQLSWLLLTLLFCLPARADRYTDSRTQAKDAQDAANQQRQQAQAARNLAQQLEDKAKKDDQTCAS